MEKQSILVIEDNPEMQIILKAILEKKYRLSIAGTAREGYEELSRGSFDLLVVDIDLPDESGFQLCARIKMDPRLSQIPFVFLTSHTQTPDVVVGFSLGADDYIVKPIVREEFEARIGARLRRTQAVNTGETISRHGDISLDMLRYKAFVHDGKGKREIQLTAHEFRLLKCFIDHDSHVLSRQQILDNVWGDSPNVTNRTVDTHVYTLRKKLGEVGSCIRTVSGVGYQFDESALRNAS